MAVAEKTIVHTLPITHLRGCPVLTDTSDVMQARVESYRMQRNAMRLNFEGTTLTTPWITVVHCCECGAVNYIEEA